MLCIDDDPGVQRLLRLSLETEGFRAVLASNGDSALRLLAEQRPSAIVLDVMLPGESGLDLLSRIKERSPVPVLVLTANADPPTMIDVIERGADDFLRKPFAPEELASRIWYLLGRPEPAGAGVAVRVAGIEIDCKERSVRRGDAHIVLCRTEWMLVESLVANDGEPLLHSELLMRAFGKAYQRELGLLALWVSRLRRKLEGDTPERAIIVDFHGVGYGMAISDPEDL